MLKVALNTINLNKTMASSSVDHACVSWTDVSKSDLISGNGNHNVEIIYGLCNVITGNFNNILYTIASIMRQTFPLFPEVKSYSYVIEQIKQDEQTLTNDHVLQNGKQFLLLH